MAADVTTAAAAASIDLVRGLGDDRGAVWVALSLCRHVREDRKQPVT